MRHTINGEALDKGAIVESLNSKKMATLFNISKKHDVAHLVAVALDDIGICLDDDIGKLFEKEREQALLRYEMINADIEEISDLFEKEGIDYIPLKGAVLRSYYPKPWMRTSCDIDILVKEEDLDKAINALVEKLSYKTDYERQYHDVSLFSPFGMHLELHFNIKEDIEKYDELLTQVWTFSRKAEPFFHKHLQSNEFFMLHLLAHMAYHFISGGCGVRSVLDFWILSKKLSINEKELISFLKRTELESFYYAIKELSEYWLEGKSNPCHTVLEAEKYILLGGAYGNDKNNATSKQIKKGGKLKYFLSRVFMPYDSLAILYPIIKRHKILTPFCQLARWLSVVFKGKKIKKEIKRITSVSQAQVEKTKTLLRDLGL
ncbi:MAG: nucleotidyltransferase family protein [Clostridia bacterium]|nr:nucleotidyltransferase family protein [Clostridia bacterium]